MRALATLVAYACLALLPLAMAWAAGAPDGGRSWAHEFALAAGFAAFGVLALEFVLVARLRPLNTPFGSDALMLFHRQMGLAAVALVLLHAIPLALRGGSWRGFVPFVGGTASSTGAIAFWALAALVGLSLVRRRLGTRYETWKLGHRWLGALVLIAMLLHGLGSSAHAVSPAVRGVLIACVAGSCALLVHFHLLRPLTVRRRAWTVVENRIEDGDVRTLLLRPGEPSRFSFQPGQFVWLSTRRPGWRTEDHPISIASSAERSEVELSIKALGDWSRDDVPRIAPGDSVWLDGPYGAFTPDDCAAEAFVLIAGGIGVTPMRSMLLTLRDRGDRRPVLLIYAARNASRAPFREELARLQGELALRVVYVFEEGGNEPGTERGFVTAELLRRHLPVRLERTHAFVCGPAPMMRDLERTLRDVGFVARNVHTERFDMV